MDGLGLNKTASISIPPSPVFISAFSTKIAIPESLAFIRS